MIFQVLFTLKKKNFLQSIYFWLCWVFAAVLGFPLVAVHGLLTAVVSLVAEHRLLGTGAQ